MANTSSYKKTAPDLAGLLAACRENAAVLPDVTAECTALEQGLAKAKILWDRQVSFTAARQETTQQLQLVLQESRGIAETLRDAVKYKIGRRNERLVQFKVAPLRKPSRRAVTEKKKLPLTPKPE
jgi:hypothetical protein